MFVGFGILYVFFLEGIVLVYLLDGIFVSWGIGGKSEGFSCISFRRRVLVGYWY